MTSINSNLGDFPDSEFLEKYGLPEGDLMTRYKYYGSLGYDNAPEANLRAITHSELYYANPSQFNDPFDCLPIVNRGCRAKNVEMLDNLLESTPNALQIFRLRRPDLQGCTYEELYAAAVSEMTERTSSLEYIRIFIEKFKVLCLTRDPINMLMWSHYGNSHTGYALEFTLNPDLPIDGNISPIRVQYEETRLHMDEAQPSNDILHYKNPVWEYEKEDRIVLMGKSGVMKYHSELLTSVIFGANIEKEMAEKLSDAVETTNAALGLDIKTYKVCLSDDTYQLSIPDHPYFEYAMSEDVY